MESAAAAIDELGRSARSQRDWMERIMRELRAQETKLRDVDENAVAVGVELWRNGLTKRLNFLLKRIDGAVKGMESAEGKRKKKAVREAISILKKTAQGQ